MPKGAEAQEFPWQLPPFFAVTAGNAQLVSVPAAIGWHEGRRISNLATDFLKKMDHKDVRVYVLICYSKLIIIGTGGIPQP